MDEREPRFCWDLMGRFRSDCRAVEWFEDKDEFRLFQVKAAECKGLAQRLDVFFAEQGVGYGKAVEVMRCMIRFYLLLREERAEREVRVKRMPREFWDAVNEDDGT